jgi:acyl-CoA oxidase
MLVIFAQLIVGDENHGVHVFLTPVRDSNHEPFDGCLVGDCGDKIGLQGIDNGWCKFNNYMLPKDLLLNKFADVTDDGKYISSIPSSSKRFGYHLAALSGGRVLAASNATDVSLMASMTAIRFSACRRQFSRTKGGEEALIIDYPLHQARIIPSFAQGFMESIAIVKVWEEYIEKSKMLLDPSNKAGEYFHLVSSAMKAVTTWNAHEVCRESRLACGGLGYHALNSFGNMGETADINQTWEGENYVLIQQACKLLLKNFSNLIQGKDSMATCEFMTADAPDEFTFTGSFNSVDKILELFSYKANRSVHDSIMKIQIETMKEQDDRLSKGEIWEKHLYFNFIPMVKLYVQRYILIAYIDFLQKFNDSPQSKAVLTKVCLLHFYNFIIKNEGQFRDSVTSEQIEDLREASITLCRELRPEVVGLTMTIPLMDYMFGSIGKSSMQPYAEMMKGIVDTPGCFGKPKEWKYLYQSKL